MTEKKTQASEQEQVKGIVMYTDGGVRPTNPGPAGWGFHGYTYSNIAPKKGSGNTKYHLTEQGYKEKISNKLGEVKPLNYINGFGSVSEHVTNNVAEILASTWALNYAKNFSPESVMIITDSEQVVNGMTHYVAKWQQNGWLKSDGAPVKNRKQWEDLQSAVNDLSEKGVNVNFKWIKGHSNHAGNNEADFLATLGTVYARKNETKAQVDIDPADGYWSRTLDKHPMMSHRYMYFISNDGITKPGVYYFGNHGKDDDLIGWAVTDAVYCVTLSKEPIELLESIRKMQFELAQGDASFIFADVANIYSKAIEISRYGESTIYRPNPYTLDLNFIDKTPFTREVRPPKLAMRIIDALNNLLEVLESYSKDTVKYITVPLTDLVYFQEQTKKETRLKIRSEIEQDTVFEIPVLIDDSGIDTKIRLTVGMDLADRNTLKKLEKHNPQINLVIWRESDNALRYACVVKCDEGQSIYGAIYCNRKLIFSEPKKIAFSK